MTLYRIGLVLLLLFGGAGSAAGQSFSGLPPRLSMAGETATDSPAYYYDAGLSKFVNSFTSYQFPNPFPPYQDPLSRLEFPIDQWFVTLAAGYRTSWWSLNGTASVNLTRESSLKMQDSDWDDETNPGQKTIFSESKCRLNRGLLVDLYLSMAARGRSSIDVSPVLGYRYQRFYFTTHDGYQAQLGGAVSDLPGDGIDFWQTFRHYYIGGVLNLDLRGRNLPGSLPDMKIRCRLDYGLVNALNQDLHLLRRGERITKEDTSGHCWHVALNAGFNVGDSLKAFIEGDFKRIVTNGDHRLLNREFAIDFSFDGSRVWSDQASLTATAEWLF